MPFDADYLSPEPAPDAVRALPGATLLEFGAPWCPHCRAAQPLLEQALQAHPQLRHLKIADGRGQPLGRAFGVTLWPTLVLLRDGQELARSVRPRAAEAVQALLAPLS